MSQRDLSRRSATPKEYRFAIGRVRRRNSVFSSRVKCIRFTGLFAWETMNADREFFLVRLR